MGFDNFKNFETFTLVGTIEGRYKVAHHCDLYIPGWNARVIAVHPLTKTTHNLLSVFIRQSEFNLNNNTVS